MTPKNFFSKILKWIFLLTITASLCVAVIGFYFFNKLQDDLPDIKQLNAFEYQVPLSIYSSDEVLLSQFGEKKRIPITISDVPQQLINAFLAAEDGNFYSHPGVDFKGLARAAFQLILTGKKKQGGSTITMQVTRNFLLSREKTYIRKFKEIVLALKIEKEYSKDKILELYLNKIFLGHHAYGIAAASATYYGKDLSELELSQLAMLAGLPKAPSIYNPITNPERASQRRNYVLRRMRKLNFINEQDFDSAIQQPISASIHSKKAESIAPYISEMVRNKLFNQYGEGAYTTGLKVYTTINSQLQLSSIKAVRSALHNYDHRHGYRSLPHRNNPNFDKSKYRTIGDTQSAHVIEIKQNIAYAKLKDDSIIQLPFENISWAKQYKTQNSLGSPLKSITDIIKTNDLIQVRKKTDNTWELTQIPDAEAAFIALNSNNGAILALTGGFDFFNNKYNRATQAKRQPGSGFKPIIYTTALEEGFTTASLINDAPIVVDDPLQEGQWKPENYSKKFFGLTPLRTALRKSRNLVSIRLLRDLGIPKVTETALRFGFTQDQLPNSLSLALGSGHATPLQMATMFSVFENGGFLVKPYFIDRIEDNKGNILYQATPPIACKTCEENHINKPNLAPRIISPQISYLMNSLLRDVIQRGTATRAKVLNRYDMAGKTGTTNEQRDTWFNGFSAGISATAWLGFDTAKPLGRTETGGKAALPIWIDFMRTALKNRPEQEFTSPEGITKAFIDPKTGLLAPSEMIDGGIWEYFLTENVPTEFSLIPVELEDHEATEEESLF
ncbi:MAG: penicillin-binding protein 1A [Methylococcales bacterium]|nr:penicillin-binding protein 1A [Methylococcales bacterium]